MNIAGHNSRSPGITVMLVIGFILIQCLFVVLWLAQSRELASLSEVANQNRLATDKTIIITQMIEVARIRTRRTADILYTHDVFEQDEIIQEIEVEANRFARARLKLHALPLTESEITLLKEQDSYVADTLPSQRRAMNLAMDGNEIQREEALHLLYKVVLPGQGKIIDKLIELLNIQKQILAESDQQYQLVHSNADRNIFTIFALVLLISIIAATIVIMRTRRIETSLATAKESAQNALNALRHNHENLENIVSARTEELAQSRHILELVINAIPQRVFWKDMEGKYLGCNRSYARDAGFASPDELIGKTDRDMPWSEHAERFARVDRSVIDTQVPRLKVEELLTTYNGNSRWFEVNKTPITNTEDETLGILGTFQDITERKEREEELLQLNDELIESEEKYRRLFEYSEDPMWIIVDKEFILANDAASRILGYESVDELTTTHPSRLSPEYQPDGHSSFDKANAMMDLAYQYGYHRFEWIHQKKNGDLFPVEVTLTKIPAAGKDALFCVWRDITEHKNLEQNLDEARKEAVSANQAKSDFLSSMSHELRTPLNAILGFSQLLKIDTEHPLSAEQKDHINDIINAGNILLELINEVLDLAKIESGGMDFETSRIELSELLNKCLSLIKPLAINHHVQLIHHAVDAPPIWFTADKTRIKQVFLNLLSNAIKYNRHDGSGTVTIDHALSESGRFRLNIRDTGNGIGEKDIPQLFTAFNRLNYESSAIEGSGIGLVITKKLVELMGGSIGVESKAGVGSNFWIEFPTDDTRAHDSPAKGIPKTRPHLNASGSILYIEDNAFNLKLVAKIISKQTSYTLYTAEEPIKGLELAIEHRPQLILLDINLPVMNGFEVLKRLRDNELTKDSKIIALSANAMPKDIEAATAAGFDDYLTKPLDIGEFLATLQRHQG